MTTLAPSGASLVFRCCFVSPHHLLESRRCLCASRAVMCLLYNVSTMISLNECFRSDVSEILVRSVNDQNGVECKIIILRLL